MNFSLYQESGQTQAKEQVMSLARAGVLIRNAAQQMTDAAEKIDTALAAHIVAMDNFVSEMKLTERQTDDSDYVEEPVKK
jgi:hypothetical protein